MGAAAVLADVAAVNGLVACTTGAWSEAAICGGGLFCPPKGTLVVGVAISIGVADGPLGETVGDGRGGVVTGAADLGPALVDTELAGCDKDAAEGVLVTVTAGAGDAVRVTVAVGCGVGDVVTRGRINMSATSSVWSTSRCGSGT